MTPRNLLQHELVGLPVEISQSRHKGHVGVRGTVVSETMRTLVIQSPDRRRTVPKAVATFVFTLPSGVKVEVDGAYLVGRPWDRVKNIPRRLW
ncbi:MAG: ribonuclease P protein component 1 [Candidatus Bathyarchaeia archaeon]